MTTNPGFGKGTTGEEVAKYFENEIKGKNVLITGCSLGGLGLEFARTLSRHGVGNLVITCRNQSKVNEAIDEIRKVSTDAQIHGVVMEQETLGQTRSGVEYINNLPFVLDVAVLNAGLAGVPELTYTEDGFEKHMAINHFSPVLQSKLLLPKMLSNTTRKPVLVVVTSGSVRFQQSGVDYSDPNYKTRGVEAYNRGAYPTSKIGSFLFPTAVARRFGDRVTALSVSPGMVQSNLSRNLSKEQKIKAGMLREDGSINEGTWLTQQEGIASYIVAGFDPKIHRESNGDFVSNCIVNLDTTPEFCRGEENEKQMWEMTEKCLGEEIVF